MEVDGETTETIGVEDKSILTYDGVRELLLLTGRSWNT